MASRGAAEQEKPDRPGRSRRRRGRIGLVVAASMVTGVALAVVVVVAPVIPATGSSLTGGVLLAFGSAWALLALLSIRFTDQPQRWALVPAAFLGLAACVTFSRSTSADTIFGWVWPVLLFGIVVWMLVSIHRRLPSRLGRWLLYPLVAAFAVASVSGGYATVNRALHPAAQTMPGLLVNVGDHRLHLHCTGTGGPTVVLEPGLGGVSTDLHWIAAAVARDTRVCVYDRAGRGWSDAPAGPQDAIHIAADLRTLLDRAHVPGPYVLAGHSFGGLYSLSFAAQFPDQVAGMVLLDSTAPRPAPAEAPSQSNVLGRVAILMGSLGGVAAGPEHASFLQEFLEGSASVQEAAALTDLHGKPLVVVTADSGHDPAWLSAQQNLTTLSTNRLHRFAQATHQSLVADQVASAAASSAIREVVASLRTFQPLNSR